MKHTKTLLFPLIMLLFSKSLAIDCFPCDFKKALVYSLLTEPALVSTEPWQDTVVSVELGSRVEPAVRVRGQSKAPGAECFLYFACPNEAANLPHY